MSSLYFILNAFCCADLGVAIEVYCFALVEHCVSHPQSATLSREVSWRQPNTALMCGAMESMHHSCYKEYSGHLIGLRENINTTDLRRTYQVTAVRIG